MKVGLVFVNDAKMKELSEQYFGSSVTTDVISFPLKEKLPDGIYQLGEIIVNLDQARRQAQEFKLSEKEEIARLITHGALHLLGYDDKDGKSAQKMEQVQEKVVRKVLRKKEDL